jgi:hypothetical protein
MVVAVSAAGGASSAAAAGDGASAAAAAFDGASATAFVGASAAGFGFDVNGASAAALVQLLLLRQGRRRSGHLDAVTVNLDANLLGVEPADLDAGLGLQLRNTDTAPSCRIRIGVRMRYFIPRYTTDTVSTEY